ncbi:type II toxin-antitoxin system HicB family antitoxin [bacterium]|nr:type II toxin-antitoxin system HicB family antitoxin [bacterium]
MKNNKHKLYKYIINIVWSEEDQVYVASVPELKSCATHGKTVQAAVKNINEAIAAWTEAAEEAGVPIPEPISDRKFSGKFVTRIEPEIHRKLFIEAKKKGKSLNTFVKDLLSKALKHA